MIKFQDLPYQRPDFKSVQAKFLELVRLFKSSSSAAEALKAARTLNNLASQTVTQAMLAQIRFSEDTRDEFYSAESSYWEEYEPQYEELYTEFSKALLASPYRTELATVFPDTVFKMAENRQKSFSPAIISLKQQENKLMNSYSKLIASADIQFQGQHLNLPQLGKFSQSADRAVRKAAIQASTAWFTEHEAEFDTIYDQLVQVRTKIAQTLGFADYSEFSYVFMNRFDYDEAHVAVYRQQIRDKVVPLVSKLKARQQARLGLDHLAFYDESLAFLTGNPTPEGTPTELVQKAQTMYREMSPETGEFFDKMVTENNLDLVSRPGKQSGGYCEYLPAVERPFIFANFNGTSGDVDVLTHEAGHAFQTYQTRGLEAYDSHFPTFEAAEIFSMSMEFIAYPWMAKFFGDQTDKYKFDHLSSALTFLPYGILVDHFQHEVYTHYDMTPDERKATWRRLEKAYLPHRDYTEVPDLDRGIYWFRQGHIFESPFYYIDYTLAQVVAFEFWYRFQIEHDDTAWSDYLAMAQAGGSQTFGQLLKTGHLQNPLAKGTLDQILVALDDTLAAVDDQEL